MAIRSKDNQGGGGGREREKKEVGLHVKSCFDTTVLLQFKTKELSESLRNTFFPFARRWEMKNKNSTLSFLIKNSKLLRHAWRKAAMPCMQPTWVREPEHHWGGPGPWALHTVTSTPLDNNGLEGPPKNADPTNI